jgi:hypothetical protein
MGKLCCVLILGTLLVCGTRAQCDTPLPFVPLPAEVSRALQNALTGLHGEYVGTAYYAAVVEKQGSSEPYRSLLEMDRKRCVALQKLCRKYQVTFPQKNPYLRKVSAPKSRQEAARYGQDLAQGNILLYDKLLPDVKDYRDIRAVFLLIQRETRELHLPMLRSAAEQKPRLPKRPEGNTIAYDAGIAR